MKQEPPRMMPPMRLDPKGHAFARFVERWWPLKPSESIHPKAKAAATKKRLVHLEMAVRSGAWAIEVIPDERQSIWGFTLHDGPRKGEVALMVVAADGTVRTVLPPSSQRPASRRRVR